jgi:transglutaminase-like putative cysteine protease
MAIAVRSTLQYEVQQPSSFFFVMCAAVTGRQKVVDELLTVAPHAHIDWLSEPATGNRLVALTAEPGPLTLSYAATVELLPFTPPSPPEEETPFAKLPADVLPYLRPSRYCESDIVGRLAFRTFGASTPGVSRVADICNWVNDHLDYVPGSTDASTTALQAFTQAAGVCRDYAHLAITMCRAMGVPARYVSGYAVDLDPPDFHGFFEAFLANQWYLFDATQMAPVDQLVRIAVGRDAADVAFASYVGSAILDFMEVSAVDLAAPGSERGSRFISTA